MMQFGRSCEIFGEFGEGLEVAAEDGIDEHARVVGGVAGWDIHDVGLDDDGARGGARVEGCDGAVVGEAVIAADHAEANDVALVVEDVEALGADGGREAGDHAHLAERADVAVSQDDVAALHEVLVGLWVVEAPHHGPHGGDRRRDLLHHGGAALVRGHRVDVVAGHHVWDRSGGRRERGIRHFFGLKKVCDQRMEWFGLVFPFLFFKRERKRKVVVLKGIEGS
ncbi:uncharacterized protein HKW66_Vig0115240 [Vigna angularis]|uniref:Uncharacterized protein n=2 Tax=Phaseolus angularis TaxID=3914 RepID=A0A8T0KZE7_PHAAN|nr:uncharacterized protein HKW66_Vig0115240 [Vigna angularis]BAT84031.1 hypothetical protein VIGAN_04129500 [Vigna angularis var. angularis]